MLPFYYYAGILQPYLLCLVGHRWGLRRLRALPIIILSRLFSLTRSKLPHYASRLVLFALTCVNVSISNQSWNCAGSHSPATKSVVSTRRIHVPSALRSPENWSQPVMSLDELCTNYYARECNQSAPFNNSSVMVSPSSISVAIIAIVIGVNSAISPRLSVYRRLGRCHWHRWMCWVERGRLTENMGSGWCILDEEETCSRRWTAPYFLLYVLHLDNSAFRMNSFLWLHIVAQFDLKSLNDLVHIEGLAFHCTQIAIITVWSIIQGEW